jgi:hypothetical protein
MRKQVSDLVFTHYAPEAPNVYLEARTSLELIEWTEFYRKALQRLGKNRDFTH